MRLTWDNTGERFYETGVKNGVIYPFKVVGSDVPYSKGVAWNGLTAVTESPSGADANNIYADDMKYLVLRAAEEFGATVEAYTYPDEFAECDGSAFVANGVSIGQQTRKPFGFCYRTILGNDEDANDHGYKLHLIYNATASPSEKSYQTVNDSPEAITFSWELTTTPVAVTGYKATACITIDSTKADSTALDALEDILYGTENTDARLPLPDEVMSIMGGGAFDISLNRANATVKMGNTLTLRATTTPSGKSVTWASATEATATVSSSGVVTPVAVGTSIITASFIENGVTYSDSCKVTVVAAS